MITKKMLKIFPQGKPQQAEINLWYFFNNQGDHDENFLYSRKLISYKSCAPSKCWAKLQKKTKKKKHFANNDLITMQHDINTVQLHVLY